MANAQFSEDELVLAQFPDGFKGVAVDVGACDGVLLSNTHLLEQRGWQVYCIEPNPHWEGGLKANNKRYLLVACAERNEDNVPFHVCSPPESYSSLINHGRTPYTGITVPVRTLDWCLNEFGVTHMDVLSIDVEGSELDVLAGFDIGKWRPKVIVIENWAIHTRQGETDRVEKVLAPHGYTLILRNSVNEVYRYGDGIGG